MAIWIGFSACSGDRDLPASYRRVAVPERRLHSSDARARGALLYAANCAFCHGTRLDGQGIRKAALSTPPRSFIDVTWQRSRSARRIFFTIREGVPGTPMPAWRDVGVDATWDLVAYIRSADPEAR